MSIFNNGIEIIKIIQNGIEIDKIMSNGVEVFAKATGAWVKSHTLTVGNFADYTYGFLDGAMGSISPTTIDLETITGFSADIFDEVTFILDSYDGSDTTIEVSTATDSWSMIWNGEKYIITSSTLSTLIVSNEGGDVDFKLEIVAV